MHSLFTKPRRVLHAIGVKVRKNECTLCTFTLVQYFMRLNGNDCKIEGTLCNYLHLHSTVFHEIRREKWKTEEKLCTVTPVQ